MENIKKYLDEMARELGLVDRKSNDRVTAEIITDKLRDLNGYDPCKYDLHCSVLVNLKNT